MNSSKNVCEYEKIRCRIEKKDVGFWRFLENMLPFPSCMDFRPHESDSIIEDLVGRLHQYSNGSGLDATMTYGQDGRITKAKISSDDGLISGYIQYINMHDVRVGGNGIVLAELEFKSNDPADKMKYVSLAKAVNLENEVREPKVRYIRWRSPPHSYIP